MKFTALRWDKKFIILSSLVLFLQAIDGYITTKLLRLGGIELNPIVTPLVEESWFWFLKLIITFSVIFYIFIRSKGNYNRANLCLVIVSLIYMFIIGWNLALFMVIS